MKMTNKRVCHFCIRDQGQSIKSRSFDNLVLERRRSQAPSVKWEPYNWDRQTLRVSIERPFYRVGKASS